MEKRICPSCKSEWYSADEEHDWTCDKCGTVIPKTKENKIAGIMLLKLFK